MRVRPFSVDKGSSSSEGSNFKLPRAVKTKVATAVRVGLLGAAVGLCRRRQRGQGLARTTGRPQPAPQRRRGSSGRRQHAAAAAAADDDARAPLARRSERASMQCRPTRRCCRRRCRRMPGSAVSACRRSSALAAAATCSTRPSSRRMQPRVAACPHARRRQLARAAGRARQRRHPGALAHPGEALHGAACAPAGHARPRQHPARLEQQLASMAAAPACETAVPPPEQLPARRPRAACRCWCRPAVSQAVGRWAAIAISDSHAAGLSCDGQLYTWGNNNRGQLGLGDKSPGVVDTPVSVNALADCDVK